MTESNVHAEAVRNRLLRRADWRFLLADSQPANSICFAGGLLADAVRLVSQKMVDAANYGADYDAGCQTCQDGSFDLAVVSDPAPATLEAAWQSLQPGGALYGEWNNPLTATSTRVARQLQTIGFTPPACYWPSSVPERETAGAWLPLAAPGALSYYAQSRNVATGAVLRTALHAKYLLWLAIARMGMAMPLCAVAYKPAPGVQPAGTLQHLHQNWQMLGLSAPPRQLHWLLLTGGLSSINKVVGLVFADDEDEPRLVVKMARVPESLPALAHEAAVLRAVHNQQRGDMAGVPSVIFADSDTCLAETALTGVQLWTQLSRSNFAELATRATQWQIDLAGGAPPVARNDWWGRLVACRISWFRNAFGPAVDEQQLRRAVDLLQALPDLPSVCEQRDFSPWNVLLNDQELAVLDWEGAELHGLPVLDLVYFLTYLALFVERVPVHGAVDVARVRQVYRATLDPDCELGTVVQACLSEYTHRLGLPSSVLPPLRLLTWMIHAKTEYQAMCAESGKVPSVDRLRRSIYLNLWEEELAARGNQR